MFNMTVLTVFQPSFVITTGPAVTAVLLGNTTGVSLSLRTVSPSNTTGKISRTQILFGSPEHSHIALIIYTEASIFRLVSYVI